MEHTKICPATLKITDMRFADIDGAPKRCTLLKIYTNQGLVGYGEVRDAASKTFALMLKSRILGENPCNVDKIMNRIKQFGGHSRQGGGVSGIEIALMDLAGKAYGVPAYQLLGGKYREKICVYADTDVEGKHGGKEMGQALQKRMDMGFTFLKMDLGIGLLINEEGTLCAPKGFLDDMKVYANHILDTQAGSVTAQMQNKLVKSYQMITTPHHATGIHITEKGLDYLENYIKEVRSVIGYEIPLAIDHFGHVSVEDCIRFCRRMEPYNIAWVEDMVPWIYPKQLARLRSATTIPVCTGEDIYLKEGFADLMDAEAVSIIHPDVLTCGGMMELKKIADIATEKGVAVAIHMAESPIACMAAVHAAAAMQHILALEFHSTDVAWWQDIANGLPKPLIADGYIGVPEAPGLGIESLNDEVIAKYLSEDEPGLWEPTDEWNDEFSNDRIWS
ncbi:mandelate racemase/muconate lactonizing enzyme family protein [Chakrabartyella piscis]|uniref:mandelate racemase/muconate lactonizing enzyme family protein n=1 Tax=Chakrabartyella piscis TaxID=2918914 RepID=UPI0029586E8E|nr:mandelate racemase/muconate lactonizing enzyme family protein [Chakrabartyella piscis]